MTDISTFLDIKILYPKRDGNIEQYDAHCTHETNKNENDKEKKKTRN